MLLGTTCYMMPQKSLLENIHWLCCSEQWGVLPDQVCVISLTTTSVMPVVTVHGNIKHCTAMHSASFDWISIRTFLWKYPPFKQKRKGGGEVGRKISFSRTRVFLLSKAAPHAVRKPSLVNSKFPPTRHNILLSCLKGTPLKDIKNKMP